MVGWWVGWVAWLLVDEICWMVGWWLFGVLSELLNVLLVGLLGW